MELIGSRARGNVHDRAGIPAGLRAVGRVIDFKFPDSVDSGLKGNLILQHVIQVDAVDHEVDGVFAASGGVECKRPLAAQRRRQKPALRRCHRAWDQQGQVHKVAAVQRNLLNNVFVDHLAYGDAGGVDDGLRAFDGHDGVGTGHLKTEILNGVLAYLERQGIGNFLSEAWHLYFNTVGAGR